MGGVLLSAPQKRWQCPSCEAFHVTQEQRPHTPMHPCPKLNGLLAPYVELADGQYELHMSTVRHRVQVSEDFIGKRHPRLDGRGRPIVAVHTERADGSNDCHAFAGMATATGVSRG